MFASKDTLLTRPSGYNIARSVRLRSSASAYLNRTPSVAGNQKTWTWSAWVKRGKLGATQGLFARNDASVATYLIFTSSDTLEMTSASGAVDLDLVTTQVFRDPSAWYHLVLAVDTTQATASNRIKMYVNGIQITSFSTATYPAQNYNTYVNTAATHYIGNGNPAGSLGWYSDQYLTEINFVNAQQLTPSSFGETDSITGVWKAKKYGGTYGTNGFYLNFSDNSSNTATTIGKDYSGNGNNWTPNNISVTAGATYDSMTDVPTLTSATAANYCVLNPLFAGTSSYLTNGNLNASVSATNTSLIGTIQIPTSGKWYWEYQITTIGGGSNPMGGIATTSASSPAVFYRTNGDKLVDGTGSAYGATYTTTDTIGVAVDVDGGTVAFYKNNTSQGNITYASSGFFPALRSSAGTDIFNINFGQRPFTYTLPTGFVALNTNNLPASTITNGGLYMKPVLYTGDGTTNKSITGVGFQTDFNWTKSRSSASYSHQLSDSVRGFSKYLYSNATNAEGTDATNHIQSVNSDGYVINSGASFNASGVTYVAWNWKAGGTSASNTNGSITSTVSVGATQGFSVVTYTGNGSSSATVGHGLGVTPSMIIVKARSGGSDWETFHTSLGASYGIRLNTTAAKVAASSTAGGIISTSPTSTTFGFTAGTTNVNNANENGVTFVAYCFSAVAGYSSAFSYTGNGSSDGPFVYLGFRTRWVMVKNTTTVGGGWEIFDTSTGTTNPLGSTALFANLSDAEQGFGPEMDILSNGIKIRRATATRINSSGDTFIGFAFAESPFKTSLAR